jgi:amino-acid N-acetyltransferase
MQIRRAKIKDEADIKKLIKLYPDKLLQKYLPKISEFFVVAHNKQIIACCAFVIYSKRLAEIRSLAVVKDFQGKGIASKLIGRCLETAKKKKILEVITISGANSLFEKFGFGAFHKEKFALLKFL